MESQVAADKRNPYFDEDAFQQLLAAAYVIQQQNDLEKAAPLRDSLPARPEPGPGPDETLAIIADTQEMLRSLPYDRTAAANLVAERLQKITHANGIAIAVERDGQLEYCAALGTSAAMAGSSIAITSSPSAAENSPDSDEDRGSNSSSAVQVEGNTIALPLTCQGKVSGILEVRFNHADSIHENEMTACQLMAGLMTEALGRAADLEWKRALATERATMLEALERIMPQLERLAGEAPPEANPAHSFAREALDAPLDLNASLHALNLGMAPQGLENTLRARVAHDCATCGNSLGMGERFCGKCGAPRSEVPDLEKDLSNNSLPEENHQPSSAGVDGEQKLPEDGVSSEFPGMSDFLLPQDSAQGATPVDQSLVSMRGDVPLSPRPLTEGIKLADKVESGSGDSLVVQVHPDSASPWNSSQRTRRWLESLKADSPGGMWLARQRANVYVAVAVTLLVVAIMGWGMRSPEVLQAQSKNPAQPSLTLFEELLVKLNLAEVTPPPSTAGNPNTQVWVDLHHALYYCPGSDLYGKTAGGKFTTQRDAQLDQFEPAERKNCN